MCRSGSWSQILEATRNCSFSGCHCAAILRLHLQTKWATYTSLFRTASLLTLDLTCLMLISRLPVIAISFWFTLWTQISRALKARPQLCCQKTEMVSKRDWMPYTRILTRTFWLIFVLILVSILSGFAAAGTGSPEVCFRSSHNSLSSVSRCAIVFILFSDVGSAFGSLILACECL